MSSRYENAYDRDRENRGTGSSMRAQGRSSKWDTEETSKELNPQRRRRSVSPENREAVRLERRRYRSRSRSPNYPSRRRSRSPPQDQPKPNPRRRSRSRSPPNSLQRQPMQKTASNHRDQFAQGVPSANSTVAASTSHDRSNQLDFKPRSKSPLQEGEDEMLEEKDEPNFNPSGKLAAETKTFNGVVLKYHEPPEARKPTNKNWRLYVFKGKEQLDLFHIHRQSAYLFGRDRVVVDIPLDHPSSSKQHAVIQFRQVCSTNEFGDSKTTIKPFIIDLESANGTFVNGDKIPASRYYELQSGDVIKFGCSTREFVLIPET
ncbi:hypothetical protein PCASD_08398 [Puccinia coronata f. sp. avenae]|uniref:FHA domain-containing protein n=1 Tax=Puccinia coronata f. sp. avenae TaxID=200324 RepID=A0A2N5TFX1_9BASI|nr:hypothetical protein PCASD_08398 [Puccinia coronata f. sp. avenae]